MSNQAPQILIKFRNRSEKNHHISNQVNLVLQQALNDFQSALPEFCDPDLDPYLSICLEEAWSKLSQITDLIDEVAFRNQNTYYGFDKWVKTYPGN